MRNKNTEHHKPYRQTLGTFIQSQLNKCDSPYRNNIIGARCNALQSIFPTTCRTIGAHIFQALAAVYAQYYPSRQWDINIYGETFPHFLATQTSSKKAVDYAWENIADIAKIEYAINAMYYVRGGANVSAHSTLHIFLHKKYLVGLICNHPNVDFSIYNRTMEAAAISIKLNHKNRSIIPDIGRFRITISRVDYRIRVILDLFETPPSDMLTDGK